MAVRQKHPHSAVNFVVLLVLLRISILAVFLESLYKIKLQAEGNKGLGGVHEKSKILMKN